MRVWVFLLKDSDPCPHPQSSKKTRMRVPSSRLTIRRHGVFAIEERPIYLCRAAVYPRVLLNRHVLGLAIKLLLTIKDPGPLES